MRITDTAPDCMPWDRGASVTAFTHTQGSMQSKANGALMRVTPLAVWGHALPDDQLADCARREAALSHPNVTCQACGPRSSTVACPGHKSRRLQASPSA